MQAKLLLHRRQLHALLRFHIANFEFIVGICSAQFVLCEFLLYNTPRGDSGLTPRDVDRRPRERDVALPRFRGRRGRPRDAHEAVRGRVEDLGWRAVKEAGCVAPARLPGLLLLGRSVGGEAEGADLLRLSS